MTSLLQALRLYVEAEYFGKQLSKKDLEILETGIVSGKVYDNVRYIGKVKRLSKYSDKRIRLVLDKEIARKVSLEERSDGSLIVKLGKESGKLTFKDIFWLSELDLFPADKIKLLKWIRRQYGINISENTANITTGVDGVLITSKDGINYWITPKGRVLVEKRTKINGLTLDIYAPIDKERDAISIGTRMLKGLFGDTLTTKPYIIQWFAGTSSDRPERLLIEGIVSTGDRNYKVRIEYSPKEKLIDVLVIRAPRYTYRYNIIQNILSKRHGLYPTIAENAVSLSRIEYEEAKKIVSEALVLLKRVELVRETDPDKLLPKIKSLLETKKLPVLPVGISSLDLTVLYLKARAEGAEKVAKYLTKAYGEEIETMLKSHTATLKEYLKEKGDEKALRELNKLVRKHGSVEYESVAS